MSFRGVIPKLEYISLLLISDLLIVLLLAYILRSMFSSGYYIDMFSMYPNYFLGASGFISLLILIIIRLVIPLKILNDMIITMLPISSIMLYIDLFTRKGVTIAILPLIVVFSGNDHSSLSPDLAQIQLIIFSIYLFKKLFSLRIHSSD